jgi:hypothetical protein
VDLDTGMLEIGTSRLPVAGILEAAVVEKRQDGMASTVATVVGVSALGPLGLLVGRAARDAKLAQRAQIALKLTVDDPREPIRLLEITPQPLPIHSPVFEGAKRNAERVAAQLRVLRARCDRART